MYTPKHSVWAILLMGSLGVTPFLSAEVGATTISVAQKQIDARGKVFLNSGEPAVGAIVFINKTKVYTAVGNDGSFILKNVRPGTILKVTLIGYETSFIKWEGKPLEITLKEKDNILEGAVVTAMGIHRKKQSLTYSTQKIKSDDLMKVQSQNVANSLEGKISGVTITPSAGGAGGASKILLRGNKSILGNSSPLIVVDGIPMSNNINGQRGFGADQGFGAEKTSEGADALSLINPDDIESMNVLKGANAAALYGSQAANGVIMITTKSGREGKLDVHYTSNVTFDTPLLLPKIQNIYGGRITPNTLQYKQAVDNAGNPIFDPDNKPIYESDSEGNPIVEKILDYNFEENGWGDKIADRTDNDLAIDVPLDGQFFNRPRHTIHLTNRSRNEVRKFLRTGYTVNNSLSLSGGTKKLRNYLSLANSHSNGMIDHNSYNRNSLTLRQSYSFFNRLNIDASLNYVETVTRNRPGGGTIFNPLYHLYMTPRNVDMRYYKDNYMINDGEWWSAMQNIYVPSEYEEGAYQYTQDRVLLRGPMQNWAMLGPMQNNPYWLLNKKQGIGKQDRIFGTITTKLDIYDGLSAQIRLNYDRSHHTSTATDYATLFLPTSMLDYGRYWDSNSQNTEIYTDYLLSYNKEFEDHSVSASVGYVGHTSKNNWKTSNVGRATYPYGNQQKLPTEVNIFETNAGDYGVTTTGKNSNWDKAYLFTAQYGYKDMVYVDGSYRRDWYRPYRQFKKMGVIDTDNFGYFGVGANAILTNMLHLPEQINYIKYRVSYSEVGNSIPNQAYFATSKNFHTGGSTGNHVLNFKPEPETNRSFETGLEMLFFKNKLSLDVTYYNSTMSHLYLITGQALGTLPVNSARINNQGIETTVGYDFRFYNGLRWKTSYNISYNKNLIKATAYDDAGNERKIQQNIAGAHVRYKKGGSIGDIYVGDYARYTQRNVDKFKEYYAEQNPGKTWDKNTIIDWDGEHNVGDLRLTKAGSPKFDNSGQNDIYVGNMNSKWQMGWYNTFYFKDLSLSFLINGRIGGKVISMTESYLDNYGFSKRTAAARQRAEKENIVSHYNGKEQPGMPLGDGSGRIVPIRAYYEGIGSHNPMNYIYSATNFRLRELSMGYTFRDLFGDTKNLSISFIARNLFFIYKDAPVDPDISLSTGNGFGAFECFNMPSARSFGFSMKVNF